jgi:hypothetical protein
MTEFAEQVASRIRDSLWAVAANEVKLCASDRAKLRQLFEVVWETRNHGFCCDHIVTEDGNTDDSCVDFCITEAEVERHYDCMLMLMVLRAIQDEGLRDKVISNEA